MGTVRPQLPAAVPGLQLVAGCELLGTIPISAVATPARFLDVIPKWDVLGSKPFESVFWGVFRNSAAMQPRRDGGSATQTPSGQGPLASPTS